MPMDETENQIIANVVSTLSDMTTSPGVKTLGRVEVTDDVDSFIRQASPAGKIIAGVVHGTSERRPGMESGIAWQARLPVTVILKTPRKDGSPETAAAVQAELNRVAGAVRDALLADKSRGGLAGLVEWGGDVINGTDVDGPARIESRQWRTAFGAVSIPVVVGIVKAA